MANLHLKGILKKNFEELKQVLTCLNKKNCVYQANNKINKLFFVSNRFARELPTELKQSENSRLVGIKKKHGHESLRKNYKA